MENDTDRLKELLSAHNGIIISATVTGLGIPRYKPKERVDEEAAGTFRATKDPDIVLTTE
jgi:hypothetical protein